MTNKRAIGGMSAKLAWLTCSLTALAIVAIVGQPARTAGGTFHECLKQQHECSDGKRGRRQLTIERCQLLCFAISRDLG